MKIVIIGTGNTATILGKKLKDANHNIVQIYGRDAKEASALAYQLQSESTSYWTVVNRDAEVYIVAVSDIAIAEVIEKLQLPQKTVVHTAASVSKNILKKDFKQYGVLYPLQSLNKAGGHLPDVPIIIDASDEETLQQLTQLAQSISTTVVQADDDTRLKLHVAAVFCNNFVNHLYTLTERFCIHEGISFSLLLPLIKETAQRLENIDPAAAQTGPALRNDAQTIEKHLHLLEGYPGLKKMYELFTNSIRETQ